MCGGTEKRFVEASALRSVETINNLFTLFLKKKLFWLFMQQKQRKNLKPSEVTCFLNPWSAIFGLDAVCVLQTCILPFSENTFPVKTFQRWCCEQVQKKDNLSVNILGWSSFELMCQTLGSFFHCYVLSLTRVGYWLQAEYCTFMYLLWTWCTFNF